jgi:hypothetical protein
MRREADEQTGRLATLSVELDGRTGHGSIRAEDTTVPRARLQESLATCTLVEEDARVRRHRLDRRMAAFWTNETRFELHGPSCRITDTPITCRVRRKGFVESNSHEARQHEPPTATSRRECGVWAANSDPIQPETLSGSGDCYAARSRKPFRSRIWEWPRGYSGIVPTISKPRF